MADAMVETGWNVLARRLAKPTDSAKVRKVGYVCIKMLARSMEKQMALAYAMQGNIWNGGAIEAYTHTALPESDVINAVANWRKDVECAGLALIGEHYQAAK